MIENAKIKSTMLGIEDHGILTFFLYLEGGAWGQGLGGYALDGFDRKTETRKSSGIGLEAIRKILETLDLQTWEELPGTLVRVQRTASSSPPIIGHILKDQWFDLRKFMGDQS